ncbi:MAG: hypothetical protein QG597_1832 [Actinomycetota bacterium]|nr:hypothetical protein [Actinomycetota bacterium]
MTLLAKCWLGVVVAAALGLGALVPVGPAMGAVGAPSGLTARFSAGQTFLTWTEDSSVVGEGYHVYRASTPISTASLAGATRLTTRWGPLGDDTSRNYLAGENSPANLVVTDLGSPLADATGLFVRTVHADDAGPAYYAVTRVVAGVEDRIIVAGANATASPVAEVVATPRPVLVSSRNGGLGRVYTHFMDYAAWNPTKQGYAYTYAVGLPRGYDPSVAYPIKVELHAYGGRYRALPEAEYDWPAIHLLPDDPALGTPDSQSTGHTWWFGFAADHDYRTSATPAAGTVANFTEYRVLKAIDEVAAMFRTDPARTHAFGHSMGASGAFSLGLRYGNVFSAVYASQPMTDYPHSPTFVEEWEELWGTRAANLPLSLLGDHAAPLRRFAAGGATPTGVWEWQNHQGQAARLAPLGPAYLMFGHGKDDDIIDWATQGRPVVRALTDAGVPFSAVMRAGQDHSWMGFDGANHDMVSRGYGDLGDFILDREPLPAFGRSTGSGPLDPTDAGTQYYNVDLSWATADNGRGPAPVDQTDRFEVTMMSTSGAAQVADVTPRRTALVVAAGSRWTWRATDQASGAEVGSGTVTAAGAGTVTVPRVRILGGAGTRLVLSPVGAPAQRPALDWFPTTTDGRVQAFSDQLPMNEMSDAQVAFAARNYVGSQKLTAAEIALLRAVNPRFALLHYRLGTASGPLPYIHGGDWASDWAAVTGHEEWFEHSSTSGQRLYQSQHQWYLHDVTNAGFRQYWTSSTIADMRATGAQGVFADSFTAGIGGLLGQQTGDPRFDGTGALTGPWTGGTWLDRLAAWSRHVRDSYEATDEGFLFLPNIDNLTTSWSTLDLSAIDGGMLENFAQDAPGYWADAAEYAAAMDRALALSAQGKVLILQTEQIDDRHRQFLVGSYYLMQGQRTYLNVVEGDSLGMYWWPEYGLDLGEPLAPVGTMAQYDGVDGVSDQVYRRDFARGVVVVNGADEDRTVTVPAGAWRRVSSTGGGAVQEVDIAPDGSYVGGSLSFTPVAGTMRLAPGDTAILVPSAAPAGAVFVPVAPARVADTRVTQGGAGALSVGERRSVSVASSTSGAPVVPAGATAVAYNLTVPGPTVAGHLRVMPGDAATTPASAINFRAGETIANASVVALDGARGMAVLNAAGAPVDAVIDVIGYFAPVGAVAAGAPDAGRFGPIAPVRAYDAAVDPAGLLAAGASRLIPLGMTQNGDTPIVPEGATAVAYNLTVVNPSRPGHLRVMPGDVVSSPASAINWTVAGDRIANGLVVKMDGQRRLRVHNASGGPVRFLIDVVGYYRPGGEGALFYPLDPVRAYDSRPTGGGGGPFGSVEQRVIQVAGAPGAATVVPTGASAVAFNLTVTGTTSLGHLRIFPADVALPDASTLNWPGGGYTRANASTVQIAADRSVRVYNGSATRADAIVDILGYYR